jgi:serine/threonine-protein kinase RsbW/sigma-B regulation protein RsbU (phosphoserine phosphatase)
MPTPFGATDALDDHQGPGVTGRVEPLRLGLVNDRSALEPTRQAVLSFLQPHGLGRQALFNAELILEETLTNLVKYAFTDGAPHRIELMLQLEPAEVIMHFEDDGKPFNPLDAPAPTVPRSIEEAVPGGLGLMLVRSFAKSVAYERRDGRNCLTIGVSRT